MLKFNREDTIVAPATAPGTAALAIIRLSGAQAFEIGDKIFSSAKDRSFRISESNSHTIHFGTIKNGNEIIDEVLVSVFRDPHSFTGEDSIEISSHGSPFIVHQIIRTCISNGARMAGPGEFTLRAFMNGKLDLSQAEAVADLIASDTASSHRLALQQMRGGFSGEIKKLREELIHFASLIELELDFSEEDVVFASRIDLMKTIQKIQQVIRKLTDSFELGNVLRHGVPVVIAGKPNVGKSTLLNALLNEERAIVSEIAGTTRDTIEEEIVLEGVKFRFIDTAGIRETHDVIEKLGVNKTFEKIRQSPVLIYLFDAIESNSNDLNKELGELKKNILSEYKIILVANKVDGQDEKSIKQKFNNQEEILFVSAKQKINLNSISKALLKQINTGELQQGDTVVANSRHAEALTKTAFALEQVYSGIEKGVTNDLVAGDLRIALHYLGEITGQVTTDDLLENIFRKFCIGK